MLIQKYFTHSFLICIISIMLYFSIGQAATTWKYAKRWPKNTVYYRFKAAWDGKTKDLIRNSLKEMAKLTCIKFIEEQPYDPPPKGQKDVHLISAGGCYSNIGQLRNRDVSYQSISLGRGCIWDSTIQHEFMHLLGFNHEQTRRDRDKFIEVRPYLIQKGREHNFVTTYSDRVYGPFDFQSVMLYTPWSFSIQPTRPVWLVKNGRHHEPVLYHGSLSWQDVKGINEFHQCATHCTNACGPNAYLNSTCGCVTENDFAKQQCFDQRADCNEFLDQCRKDPFIASDCRKSCKRCYRSSGGFGERGPVTICNDDHRLCSPIPSWYCSSNFYSYFCPKKCNSSCRKTNIPEITDSCINFNSPRYCQITAKDNCKNVSWGKRNCAKTCNYC